MSGMTARDGVAVWPYFGLVVLLSLPFYVLGATGAALPFAPALPVSAMMAVVPVFVLSLARAITEKPGQQGHAYPLLAARHPALGAAVVPGVVWALWHVIPFALMGRGAGWVLWHGVAVAVIVYRCGPATLRRSGSG